MALFKSVHNSLVADSEQPVATKGSNGEQDEQDVSPIELKHRSILCRFSEQSCRLPDLRGFANVCCEGGVRAGGNHRPFRRCGIDGFGILRINSLVSFKVIFQCKRYSTTIGPDKVRDFRGAMAGRADKGIILTTGTFTAAARAEAVRDGVAEINLIDGEGLMERFEELETRISSEDGLRN